MHIRAVYCDAATHGATASEPVDFEMLEIVEAGWKGKDVYVGYCERRNCKKRNGFSTLKGRVLIKLKAQQCRIRVRINQYSGCLCRGGGHYKDGSKYAFFNIRPEQNIAQNTASIHRFSRSQLRHTKLKS